MEMRGGLACYCSLLAGVGPGILKSGAQVGKGNLKDVNAKCYLISIILKVM